MVKVSEIIRGTDAAEWLATVTGRLTQTERELVARADLWAQECYADRRHPTGTRWIEHARAAVGILSALRIDGDAIAATLLLGAPLSTRAQREALAAGFGPAVAALVEGVATMEKIQVLRGGVESGSRHSDRSAQLESLRKMLLAMVQDVRVVLIKLADQVQLLRELAATGDAQARENAAGNTMDLFAPLANRLGIWQIKWELEDLAFRCLEPNIYRKLAIQLDETRIVREAYVDNVVGLLRAELAAAGIAGDVEGRPKHIYSIWRKMQGKGVGLEDLFDVRAVRVLVSDVRACYAVLALVHNLWTPVPREFDDYIAKPKANGYRSIHTALEGPEGKVLEVQIRTHEMHQHAELGVAAHWRYKEGVKGDSALDDRVAWLRRIIDWRDELVGAAELGKYLETEPLDSVYVVTPQGRVIDLPYGATPVDFAYHLHSEIGHRCRGAKVDGQIVPLTHVLSNGERVEIITAREGGPSRDWLNPALGYLKSNRARAKVRQWFNSQELDEATIHGRAQLERELHRLGKTGQNLDQLAAWLNFSKVEELFVAFGRAEVTPRQLQSALGGNGGTVTPAAGANVPSATRSTNDAILIVGVDKLLTNLARCCKPAPPDPIVGFVTRGRGVTVHRRECRNIARLASERLIAADWGKTGDARFAVDVEIVTGAHPAVLRDILEIFTREKVRVISSKSVTRDLSARIAFTLQVEDLAQIKRLLALARDVPGVESARRR